MDELAGDFWAVADGLRVEIDAEQRAEALDILRSADRTRRLVDRLRTLHPGDVVTIVTVDGQAVRGRILTVGADFLTVGETVDEQGTARLRVRRCHDVPLAAVSRVTREVGE